MTVASQPKVKKTLGTCAYSAIQKHLKKTLKWETTVQKDKDPEALHQMRVGMRRLRTAVTRFQPALQLPKSASDKKIGKIARCLGNLRDLDVLKDTLENLDRSDLPRKEHQFLQKALDDLSEQREEALDDVRATFKGERYKSLKSSMKEWLEKPSYQPLASLPIEQVLPDLLLPEVSQFLLHPGWLVGTKLLGTEIVVSRDWDSQRVEQQLQTSGDILHSLRKQAKRLRYQMELFTDMYGESYMACITEVKAVQEILGAIQDSVVLGEWLVSTLKSKIHIHLPTLANQLAENRYQWWQQWQPLQERYLKAETRHRFHLTMIHPI
ncbi:MAG: CHAD domain-containing protein [Scytonema sp. PMC 1069.18]|nr:CHAD domain-containing protein [Scytonema sp. PMC 1069.18]MEC4888122.1 CHAD domain-containing protein [Scytonema sp. PMC 1070.18]